MILGGVNIKKLVQGKATVNYQYGKKNGEVLSNETEINILDTYDIEAKLIVPFPSFSGDEAIPYLLIIQNVGSSSINNLTITDNLGNNNLVFLDDDLYIYLNGQKINPLITKNNNLKMVINNIILPKETIYILYFLKAKVNKELSNIITISTSQLSKTINNTLYPLLAPNIIINKNIIPSKIVKDEVITINYEIKNIGETLANNITITDQLPQDFNIIKIEVLGLDYKEIKNNEYTVTNNIITIPNNLLNINIEKEQSIILKIIGQIKSKAS